MSDKIVDHTEDDDQEEPFYFESDHLALRDNTDYTAVLKTLAILQAQKIQALQDIDKIVQAEMVALQDPEEFVAKLRRGEQLDVPKRIDILDVPKIDLDKYNVKIPELPKIEKKSPIKNNDLLVRGRAFDQSKPETFNQLWTCDEQKRLEELLIEYPPEPFESQRFTKIAKALGNRTPKQVASRVQKFFQKLYTAGLPVPGRLPKANKIRNSKNKHSKILKSIRPTTFFPADIVPVRMNENDDDDTILTPSMHHRIFAKETTNNAEKNDNDSLFTQLVVVSQECEDEIIKLPDDDKILRLLKRVKADIESQNRPESSHENFKCDSCFSEPIIGTRWHCNSCTTSIDFCSDCLVDQLMNPNKRHSLDHVFVGIRQHPVELTRKFVDYSCLSSNNPSASNSRFQSESSEDSGEEQPSNMQTDSD